MRKTIEASATHDEHDVLLTAIAVGALWGMSPNFVYARMDAGELPFYRIGKARRIRRSDADAYLAARRVGKPARHLKAL